MRASVLAAFLGFVTAQDPVREGYVSTSDGVRLYYREIGSGDPVLVVPFATWLARDLEPLAQSRRVIFYDMRGRGRSELVRDSARIGMDHDVADLEAVRRHFRLDRMQLLGYSYLGAMVVLYATKYPQHVERVVQVAPVPPRAPASYARDPVPGDSWSLDTIAREVARRRDRAGDFDAQPDELCRAYDAIWSPGLFGTVAGARRHRKLVDHCALETEQLDHTEFHIRVHMKSYGATFDWRPRVAALAVPVLTIHGTFDRNAPYIGGREWAAAIPNARLLTVPGAAHQVFNDAPYVFFPAVEAFLAGRWPPAAQVIRPW